MKDWVIRVILWIKKDDYLKEGWSFLNKDG